MKSSARLIGMIMGQGSMIHRFKSLLPFTDHPMKNQVLTDSPAEELF